MDTKIGPNVSTALTNNSGVQKAKGTHTDADAQKVKNKGAETDYNVSLSGRSKEMNEARLKALDIARNTPDVREDRVADLKARIASGEYKVSSENIADGMLREAVKDELSKGQPEL
ncbi:MAG: flagellar biosynthesis anti-sigma factor FlgM [Proteobacteria bacterium]|nr:MAG: flagellar biosynthesis anti-sigma factor FlgM [Pseudomonadota bacterium]